MPRSGHMALRPLYAARDLCRAVVVDKAFPAVRQQRCRDSVQLLRCEGRCWCVRRGWFAGSCILAGAWGSRRAGHAATGPMVTVATVDASAVRSADRYGLSPVVSGRGACRPRSRPPPGSLCGPARPRPRCCYLSDALRGCLK